MTITQTKTTPKSAAADERVAKRSPFQTVVMPSLVGTAIVGSPQSSPWSGIFTALYGWPVYGPGAIAGKHSSHPATQPLENGVSYCGSVGSSSG